jgi:hypothetical protein
MVLACGLLLRVVRRLLSLARFVLFGRYAPLVLLQRLAPLVLLQRLVPLVLLQRLVPLVLLQPLARPGCRFAAPPRPWAAAGARV